MFTCEYTTFVIEVKGYNDVNVNGEQNDDDGDAANISKEQIEPQIAHLNVSTGADEALHNDGEESNPSVKSTCSSKPFAVKHERPKLP